MDISSYTTNSLDFEGYTNLSPCKPTTSSTVKNIFTSKQICMIMSSTIQPWCITKNQYYLEFKPILLALGKWWITQAIQPIHLTLRATQTCPRENLQHLTIKNIFTGIQICTIMSSTIQPWFITNNQADKHGCDWQDYTGKWDACLICLSMQSVLQKIQMTIIVALTYTFSQFPSKTHATTQLWDQNYMT